MKKTLLALFAWTALACAAVAQTTPPITVTEIDQSPILFGVTKIEVSNGSLVVIGKTARISTGGGGGTVGQPVVGGTINTVLFVDGSGNLGSSSNFSYTTLTGAVVLTTASPGLGFLAQSAVSPINGVRSLAANSGSLEFGAASAAANFSALAVSGDGVIRASSAIGGNGNLIFVNNNSGLTGAFIWSTGALGSDTEKLRVATNGAITSTVSSATAHCVGAAGCTNPAFNVVTNTASGATGVEVVNQAAAGGGIVRATSSAGNEALILQAKATSNVIVASSTAATPRLQWGGSALASNRPAIEASSATLLRAVTGDAGNFVDFTANNLFTRAATAGTSGVGLIGVANGTAPTTSPADEFQLYSADAAATDANAYIRNEAGEVNRISGLSARVTTQFDNTTTTLGNVTGLTRNVEAGRVYGFTVTMPTTSNVGGGVKAAIAGTATATSVVYDCFTTDAGTTTQSRATALGTACGAVTAVTAATIVIRGTIVVANAGTLTVQLAANTAVGTTSALLNGSFSLIPIT